MGEAGRKLTIRMPDSNRVTSAEVAALHVDPGTRTASGAPVMTLRARRQNHVVRAPRPGRIVPLVGPGDRVRGGDPLYVLNIDEKALARQNRDGRALIPVEKARWASAADTEQLAEQLEFRLRGRAARENRPRRLFADWWGPVLAVVFYVVACFAFLPLLGSISETMAMQGRAVLLAVVALLGVLIVRLYAPRFAGLQRNIVRLVAVSWIAVGAVAVLHRPDASDDLTFVRAGERVAGLFRPADRAIAAPAPVPPSIAVESAGVYAGPPDGSPPEIAAPRFRLAEAGAPSPTPHGVSVRGWGRQNPLMRSGEPPLAVDGDTPPGLQAPDAGVVAAGRGGGLDEVTAAGSPPPKAMARATVAAVRLHAAGAMPEPRAGEAPRISAADDATSWSRTPVGLRGGTHPAPTPAALALREEAWLSAGLPVVVGTGAAAPEPADAAFPGGEAPDAVSPAAAPGRPSGPREPEPAPAPSPRRDGEDSPGDAAADVAADVPAGSDDTPQPGVVTGLPASAPAWMERLRPPAGTASPTAADPGADPGAERPAWQPAARAVAAVGDPGLGPLAVAPPPLPAPGVAVAAPEPTGAVQADGDISGSRAASAAVPARAAPEPIRTPAAPAGAPPGPRPLEEAAERRLIFLYFDDPRLDRHPQLGDRWAPAVGAEAAGAIRAARVEAVHEVLEVAEWCTPGDPTAVLSDRIRLLDVRLDLDPKMLGRVEAELPVLSGAPAALFHNRAPLLGGAPDAPLMQRARDFLGLVDRAPPGTRYFDSGLALERALDIAGCRRIEWSGGTGPVNEIGRALVRRLSG